MVFVDKLKSRLKLRKEKKMLSEIEKLVEEKKFEEALEALERITDLEYGKLASEMIARELVKSKNFDETVKFVDKTVEKYKFTLVSDIVGELAREGKLGEALKIIEKVPEELRSACYWSLIDSLIASKRPKDALKFVDKIEEFERSEALMNIAIELSSSGEFENALEVASRIAYDHFRMYALAVISKDLHDAGRDYKAVLRNAVEIADKLVKRQEIVTENEVNVLKSTMVKPDEQTKIHGLKGFFTAAEAMMKTRVLSLKHAELIVETVEIILQIMRNKISEQTFLEIVNLKNKAKSELDKIRGKLKLDIKSISNTYALGLEALRRIVNESE